MDHFTSEAEEIVLAAGRMAKEHVFSADVEEIKPFGGIVTRADKEIEAFVIDSLKRRFPGHGFDSEERGKENAGAEYVWVLDPIDGTRYYAGGVPLYAISLALAHKQARKRKLILGIVHAPELGQTYCAVSGRGGPLASGACPAEVAGMDEVAPSPAHAIVLSIRALTGGGFTL